MTPRSEEYLDFVRGLTCAACGSLKSIEAHHVEQGGVGMKGSDYSCIPLCTECHRYLEDNGHRNAEKLFNFSISMAVAETLHLYVTKARLSFPSDLIRVLFQ